jgi:hypothetical protein
VGLVLITPIEGRPPLRGLWGGPPFQAHTQGPVLISVAPMGISAIEFRFLKAAWDADHFAKVKSVLEFGESNTHNLDIDGVLKLLLPPGDQLNAALAEAQRGKGTQLPGYPWARLLYHILFNAPRYVAVDLEPKPPHVIKQDLNLPFDLGQRFDLCINNGTSEHLFNQSNFFKAMHDHTRAGGLMMHWTPCIGWIGHGLYNVQPGFFYDLALANDYEMLLAYLATERHLYDFDPDKITDAMLEQQPDLKNSLLCVLMRKPGEAAFKLPLQWMYSHLSPQQTR